MSSIRPPATRLHATKNNRKKTQPESQAKKINPSSPNVRDFFQIFTLIYMEGMHLGQLFSKLIYGMVHLIQGMTRLRNFGMEVIGWALLVLAVVVSPLPVIPSLLLLAALFILSSRYSWASRLLEKARRLLPARLSNAVPAEEPPSTVSTAIG